MCEMQKNLKTKLRTKTNLKKQMLDRLMFGKIVT